MTQLLSNNRELHWPRLLNHLYERGPAPGQLPQNLWIQQDNCGRECKNQIMFRMCIVLVLLGISRSVVLAYLRKGHTHEDIDQASLFISSNQNLRITMAEGPDLLAGLRTIGQGCSRQHFRQSCRAGRHTGPPLPRVQMGDGH
jgi:hypothetical protein